MARAKKGRVYMWEEEIGRGDEKDRGGLGPGHEESCAPHWSFGHRPKST